MSWIFEQNPCRYEQGIEVFNIGPRRKKKTLNNRNNINHYNKWKSFVAKCMLVRKFSILNGISRKEKKPNAHQSYL